MKKFLVLTYGFEPPTDDIKQAWGAWFTAAAGSMVDPGSPFGRGVEITRSSRRDLNLESPSPMVGYCLINAENLAAAEELVASMPIIEAVRVYEANSM